MRIRGNAIGHQRGRLTDDSYNAYPLHRTRIDAHVAHLLRQSAAVAGLAVATQAMAQVTFYEHEGFQGRSFTTPKQIGNFQRFAFNDRASSVVVQSERWEVYQDARFRGRCVVLRRGQYPSLAAMGLNDRVSSMRTVSRNARVDDDRYAPPPVVAHDYRRRNKERLFQAPLSAP